MNLGSEKDVGVENSVLFVKQFDQSGNACAIIHPDNSASIFDWGVFDTDSFPEFLDEFGIQRVRFIMATHSHSDHTAALPDAIRVLLQREIKMDMFIYPSMHFPNKDTNHLFEAAILAKNNGIQVQTVHVSDFNTSSPARPIQIADSPDKWELVVLAPPGTMNTREEIIGNEKGRNPGNPTSIVTLYRPLDEGATGGRALLPGDSTKAALKFAKSHEKHFPEYSLENDVIVVPHHGSKNNWPAWLTEYCNRYLIISCGSQREALPAASTLVDLTKHCASGGNQRTLHCTSYSASCRKQFAGGSKDQKLVSPGPCFGSMLVELAPTGAIMIRSDSNGEKRRQFGYCGQ